MISNRWDVDELPTTPYKAGVTWLGDVDPGFILSKASIADQPLPAFFFLTRFMSLPIITAALFDIQRIFIPSLHVIFTLVNASLDIDI